MSDRKRRNRKLMKDEKRFGSTSSNEFKNVSIQPKILLKTKNDSKSENKICDSGESQSHSNIESPMKGAIFTRNSHSPTRLSTIAKDNSVTSNNESISKTVESVPQMTRTVTIISSIGTILDSAKRLLHRSNTDFMVVGAVGTQGVGKSTILNLLANEQQNFDYYRKVFVEEDFIFPTKLKLNKCSSRSRTESTHMFITSDRLILLDTPPVMANAYKKDAARSELDDLTNIVTLMSVCHLLIIVMDDYFNLSFLNLIRYAELMKKPQDIKSFASNYYPNVLFIKNHAKRLHYAPVNRIALEEVLASLFKDSQLRIHPLQATNSPLIDSKSKKLLNNEMGKSVNVFLFPEVKSESGTTYHASLLDVVQQLRHQVFHTPRIPIYGHVNELTEELWFDYLSEVQNNSDNIFFRTYEDVHRNYLDTTPGINGFINKENSGIKSWRD